jgi:hypothetical protein
LEQEISLCCQSQVGSENHPSSSLLLWLKRLEHENENLTPSNANVNNEYSLFFTPLHGFMV